MPSSLALKMWSEVCHARDVPPDHSQTARRKTMFLGQGPAWGKGLNDAAVAALSGGRMVRGGSQKEGLSAAP